MKLFYLQPQPENTPGSASFSTHLLTTSYGPRSSSRRQVTGPQETHLQKFVWLPSTSKSTCLISKHSPHTSPENPIYPKNPRNTPPKDHSSLQPHISLHALAGVSASDTFRLYGLISSARITILVDSGSTHNFVQPRVAKFLNLPMEDTMALRVMVGNGSVQHCEQLCPDTKVLIQGHTFTVTLCVLPLSGADVIVGVK